MIPSNIIDKALQKSFTSFKDLGDGDATVGETRAYSYLNDVKDIFWSKIVSARTGKDISWDEWLEDLVVNESEYPLPQVVSEENRLKKIKGLSISYGSATYNRTGARVYTTASLVDRNGLEMDWAWYEENQPQTQPIYYTSDKAIFVAPTSSSTISDGLKLTGVKKIQDYTDSTTEAGMVIPDDYHFVLVKGLQVEFLEKKGDIQTAQFVRGEFDNMIIEAVRSLESVNTGPFFMKYPDGFNSSTTPKFGNYYGN